MKGQLADRREGTGGEESPNAAESSRQRERSKERGERTEERERLQTHTFSGMVGRPRGGPLPLWRQKRAHAPPGKERGRGTQKGE